LDVDFPACLEASLACGGTWFGPRGEHVWNEGNGYATGGGISEWIPRPAYQGKSWVPPSPEKGFIGRGTPDVSAIAVNYAVIKQGRPMRSRGTSFVAPFWAGLVARLNQASGRRVGFINPVLYNHPNVCKSITVGHNDVLNKRPRFTYEAGDGWDPATGLGVPNGPELLRVILEQNT
jgi:kumamolisin